MRLLFPDSKSMGVVNGVAVCVDKSRFCAALFGLDVQDGCGCQRIFLLIVFLRMQMDIVVFKNDAGDFVVFAAPGELWLRNGKCNRATGLRGMRRLYRSDDEFAAGAGAFNGVEVKPGLRIIVSKMWWAWLVLKDQSNDITFRGHVSDELCCVGRKFHIFQCAFLVDDKTIDVIVFIGSVAN